MNKLVLFIILTCFSTATFGQIGWGPTVDIAPTGSGNNNPKIVLNGSGDPVVSWGGSGELWSSVWNGSSFTAPLQINSAASDILEGSNYGPEIASYGDTVYGVYKETPVLTGNVYVARSTDGGLTFGTPVRVDYIGSNQSEYCHIGVDNSGNPLVLFNKFDSGWGNARWAFSRSSDYGMNFSPDTMVNGMGGGGSLVCECCPAAVAPLSSDPAVVVTYRNNESNIRNTWAAISMDGTGFIANMDIDQLNWNISSCPNTGPDIAVVGDTLYATYFTSATGQGRVYYSKSSINPPNGSAAVPVTGAISGLTNQNYPRLSISGNQGVIVWRQSVSGDQQLALSYSPDITSGFPGTYETVAMDNVTIGDVVMDGNDIHVVWRDYISNTVKYRKGTVGATGIAHNDTPQMSVYPNPSNDLWNVTLPEGIGQAQLQLFDLEGRLILKKTSSANTTVSLSAAALAKGIYHLQVTGDAFVKTVELVKH